MWLGMLLPVSCPPPYLVSLSFPSFQILDTPGLIPGFNLSELLGQQDGTTNFSEIYRWVPALALYLWGGVQLLSTLGCSLGWGQLALPG